MWIGRRALQRRVFWHIVQNLILPHARRDARLRAVACGLILHLGKRRNVVPRHRRR